VTAGVATGAGAGAAGATGAAGAGVRLNGGGSVHPAANATDESERDRRLPDLAKIHGMIGYEPRHTLDSILHDVVEFFRGQ